MSRKDNDAELRKLELRLRIEHLRERWRVRLMADPAPAGEGEGHAFPRSRTLRALMAHPGAAAAGVAAAAVLGPSRLIRWASWLLPLLMRR